MFAEELIKLNASIADGLLHLKALKSLFVKAQQYEDAAKLRHVELKLEEAAAATGCFANIYPTRIGDPYSEWFYNRLFEYAEAKNWLVPVPVEDAFKKRREKINLQNDITDEQTMFLLALNQKLTGAQEQVMEFLNFINYIVSLKDASNLPAMGSVTLVCYTAADNYPYIRKGSDSQKTFYRQRFSVEELLKSLKSYPITDKINTPAGTKILTPLPQ